MPLGVKEIPESLDNEIYTFEDRRAGEDQSENDRDPIDRGISIVIPFEGKCFEVIPKQGNKTV